MSTKKVARTSSRAPKCTQAASEVARRRARTKLLLGPTLATLRAYRHDVLQHLDATIARLDQLDQWTDGGEAPAELVHISELADRVYRSLHDGPAEPFELARLIEGPVLLCETALDALSEQAFGAAPASLNDAATRLAQNLLRSDPNHDVTTAQAATWLDTFDDGAKANGVTVDFGELDASGASVARKQRDAA
jgi:hypothetical protein